MKVSRQSWHYRWLKFIRFEIPRNLCSYFWTMVWSFLFIPVAILTALAVVFLLTLPLWAWLTNDAALQEIAMGIGIIEILLLTVNLFFIVRDRKREEAYELRWKNRYLPQEPRKVGRGSILKAWLKARKAKVCPMIEIVK